MSGKEQIEKDFRESEKRIEQKVKRDIEEVKAKTLEIKAEAKKIGEAVENSLNQTAAKVRKKKS